MQTIWNENRVILRGTAAAEPVLSHENHGVAYYTFPLSVLRLSGSEDRINVIAAASVLERCPVAAGMTLEGEGEVRSFNNKSGQGSRLGVLTKNIAKPAVPFGGKYRLIDFPLSNCVNSGVETVGVLTQYQPLELNEYIGSGQPWDLDSMDAGVHVLSPYEKRKKTD